MITCQTATERLVAHWNAPTPQVTQETQAAIEHVHHCPRCAGRLCGLIRTLQAGGEEAAKCNECKVLLPGAVPAEQHQGEEEALWQPVAARLPGCPYCQVAQAELESLLDLASSEHEQIPVPDLAFLRPACTAPIDPAAPEQE